MPEQLDAYEAQRRPEMSTYGDSIRWRDKNPDAFRAGAQFALDRLLAQWKQGPFDTFVRDMLTNTAARILAATGDPMLYEREDKGD